MILKLLGGVDRVDAERDSYVVSDQDQLEYVSRRDVSSMMPVAVKGELRTSSLLFLGTSSRTRLVRFVLDRVLGDRRTAVSSWAIQLNPDVLELGEWKRRGIEVFTADLGGYVDRLMEVVERT